MRCVRDVGYNERCDLRLTAAFFFFRLAGKGNAILMVQVMRTVVSLFAGDVSGGMASLP